MNVIKQRLKHINIWHIFITLIIFVFIGIIYVRSDTSDSGYIASYTGTGYFVDAISGDDSNPGTRALPWKTLARASSAALASGDALLLKCGDTWRERADFNSSFATQGGVLIAGYGDCNNQYPVISGAKIVQSTSTSWTETLPGSNIYSIDVDLGTSPSDLFVNDSQMRIARYPSFTNYKNEFLIIASVPTTTTPISYISKDKRYFKGNEDATSTYGLTESYNSQTEFYVDGDTKIKLSLNNPVGSNIYLRSVTFRSEKRIVTAYDSLTGKITFDSPVTVPLEAGQGYILENALWMLDDKDEWYYDNTLKKLYVYFDPSKYIDPNLTTVEATQISDLITINTNNTRIEHIKLQKGSSDGLIIKAPNSSISEVNISYMQGNGIYIEPASSGTTVAGSTLNYNHNRGIRVDANNVSITNNTITNTGMGTSAGGTIGAVTFDNQINGHLTVSNNTIASSSYLGIAFSGDGDVIEKNNITNVCLRLSDCGAIYSWNSNLTQTPNRLSAAQNIIRNNYIENVNAVSYGGSNPGFAAGIYLDDYVNRVNANNNTINNADTGIFLHNAFNNIIDSNIVYESKHRALGAGNDNYAFNAGYYFKNNIISNNTLVLNTIYTTGSTLDISDVSAFDLFGGTTSAMYFSGVNASTFTNNKIINIADNKNLYFLPDVGNVSQEYFNNLTSGFSNSRTVLPTLYTINSLGTNMINNEDFESGTTTPWTYFTSDSSQILSLVSNSWCNSYCIRVSPVTADGLLVSNGFNLPSPASNDSFMISYRVKNSGSLSGSYSAVVRKNGSPFNTLGYSEQTTSLLPGEERIVNEIFNSSTTENIRLDFNVSIGSVLDFDNISIRKINSYTLNNLSSYIDLQKNTTAANKIINCSDTKFISCDLTYDESGYPVTFPVTIPPYSSKVLINEVPSSRKDYSLYSSFLPATSTFISIIPGQNNINLTWNTPDPYGILSSTTYSLQFKKSSDSIWNTYKSLTPNLLTYNLSGLASTTLYNLRIIAHTQNGNSLPSDIYSTSTTTFIPATTTSTTTPPSTGGGGTTGSGIILIVPSQSTSTQSTSSIATTTPVKNVLGLTPNILVNTSVSKRKIPNINSKKDTSNIINIQKILIRNGYLITDKKDKLGNYGPKTIDAIKKLQCEYSIACDNYSVNAWGILDSSTIKLLNSINR